MFIKDLPVITTSVKSTDLLVIEQTDGTKKVAASDLASAMYPLAAIPGLGNSTLASQGAGLVGWGASLSYPINTAGWEINNILATIAGLETSAHASSTYETISHASATYASLSALAASSGSTLVGFLQGGTGAVNRTQQDKTREFVSVKDFGATGDGVTDDIVNIQKAVTYAQTIGAYVTFPSGTYCISTYIVVTNGVRGLIGMGGTIKCINTVSFAGIVLLGVKDGASSNVDNCTIRDMRINCNNVTATITNGIFGENCSNCTIVNNYIYNLINGHGIYLYSYVGSSGCTGNIIQGNRIYADTSGAYNYWGIGTASEINFGGYATQADYWKANFAVAVSSVPNFRNIIVGNLVSGGYYGISLSDSRWSLVAGNICTGNVRNISVQNTCLGCSITGNTFTESSSASIHLAYGSSYNVITGNQVYSTVAVGEGLLQAYVGCNYNRFTGNRTHATSSPKWHVYCAINSSFNIWEATQISGLCGRAYMAIESCWDTNTAETASRSYGQVPADGTNLFANNSGCTGNRFIGNSISGDSAVPAIFVHQRSDGTYTPGLSDTDFINNIVQSNTPTYQLKLVEITSGKLVNGRLQDNDFYRTATTVKFQLPRGLAHFSSWGNNTIISQQPDEIPFADGDTTPSVALGSFFRMANTGATSVTNFTLGTAGQVIQIRLDVNTTIVYNNALIRTKGLTNITAVDSNKIVCFRNMGGVWMEQYRSF